MEAKKTRKARNENEIHKRGERRIKKKRGINCKKENIKSDRKKKEIEEKGD